MDRPPRPQPVHLVPHDPAWRGMADRAGGRILATARSIRAIHHIGSTAIEGLLAKPIIDLLAVTVSLEMLDANRDAIEALGYAWHGPNGILRRRFCTLDDAETGRRIVHLHCFAAGDPAIHRHIAFRDHLRASPTLVRNYAAIKRDCAARPPANSSAYSACKADWLGRAEAEAIRWSLDP